MIKNILIIVVAIIIWLAYINDKNKNSLPTLGEYSPPAEIKVPDFNCMGKRYCSEMLSCEEAKFYMRNCPETELDPDGDGVPCEDLCTNY